MSELPVPSGRARAPFASTSSARTWWRRSPIITRRRPCKTAQAAAAAEPAERVTEAAQAEGFAPKRGWTWGGVLLRRWARWSRWPSACG